MMITMERFIFTHEVLIRLPIALLTTYVFMACQAQQNEVEDTARILPSTIATADADILHGSDKSKIFRKDIIGKWDIIRFDDFMPTSRLSGSGKRSAYVDIVETEFIKEALTAALHIECNFSGNFLNIIVEGNATKLGHVPNSSDGFVTQRGCSPAMHRRDELFFAMMYKSPKVEKLGEHRLRLWTDKHELILENSEIGQARDAINDLQTIEGKWHVATINQAGFGMGGHYYTPEPFIISKNKIQYGLLKPYLKNPKIEAGKLIGEATGQSESRDCVDRQLSASDNPIDFTEETALCIVQRIIINKPIAEPTSLPDHFQISFGEYRMTLMRFGAESFVYPER